MCYLREPSSFVPLETGGAIDFSPNFSPNFAKGPKRVERVYYTKDLSHKLENYTFLIIFFVKDLGL